MGKRTAILIGMLFLLPAAAIARQHAPGPEHKALDGLVGEWDVATKFRFDAGAYKEGKATCKAAWILDRRYLKQEYDSRLGGQPFQVLQILGYDALKKCTFELMMDSMGTGVFHTEGAASADGKVITNFGEMTNPMTRKPEKYRSVTTINDRDHFTLEWFRLDPDGKELSVVVLAHTRKK